MNLLLHRRYRGATNLSIQAGGLATTGTKRILDIQPTQIHERCPVFLGSKEDVQDLVKFYEAEASKGK